MLGTNHVLENSQKLPPRVFQPLRASTLAHGWVRTVRTAQNLHNADIQWAERDVEADFVEPKWCLPGRLNQNCGHGAPIRIVCDGLARCHRIAAASPLTCVGHRIRSL